jgi:hypothetical protein
MARAVGDRGVLLSAMNDDELRLGFAQHDSVRDRYRVERELGTGGMATKIAAARIALARDESDRAAEAARRALAAFGELGMPLEAGEARLELARAVAPTEPEIAREETRAALEAFRELQGGDAAPRARLPKRSGSPLGVELYVATNLHGRQLVAL